MKFNTLPFNLKIRLIEMFLNALVSNMVFPFMIIYFSDRFGASLAGIMFVLNVFVGVGAGIYGGYLADRIGRRKMMLGTECFRFVATLLMALASFPGWDSPLFVYFMMMIAGFCSGLARPASQAMLIDSSKPEERKFVYSIDYWSWNVTMLIGSSLGAFLFKDYLSWLLLFVSAASLISILFLIFLIKEMYTPPADLSEFRIAQETKTMFGNYRNVLKDSLFRIFMIATLLEVSVQFQSMNYSAVRLSDEMPVQTWFKLGSYQFIVDGVKMFGFLNAFNTTVVVLFSVLVAKLTKRISDKTALAWGICCYTIGFAFIAYSNQPWVLLTAMFVVTVGEMVYVPVKQAYLADIVPSENRGTYMAMNGLTFKGASALGSLSVTLGAIVPSWGISLMFLGVGFSSIVMFLRTAAVAESKKTANEENSMLTM